MALTVYGYFGSFCTQKVYLTLAEKGVSYERRLVNIGPPMENYEPWYARLNPNMVIPTIDHDGAIVCDSAVIIRYIDDNFDGPRLVPEDSQERALVLRWVERIDRLAIRELSYSTLSGFTARMRDRVIMPRRLKLLRKHQRAAPDLHDVYERRIADVRGWIAVMREPAEMAAKRAELLAALAELDERLQGGEFVVGERYTLADMMATVLTARVRLMRPVDPDAYPALAAHYERMKRRPNFPADDIIEEIDRARMFRLMAPVLLPRIAAALAVLGAVSLALWWLLSGP